MSASNPLVYFCTTCKGRLQHLEETLPKNIADNADYENCRFLVLDYNSTDRLADWLHARRDEFAGKVIAYSHKQPGPFRMAHAKNVAHRAALLEGADVLVNLDADNFTGPGFAAYVADQFANEPKQGLFMWSHMVKGVMPRGISGRIAVSKRAFLNAGGYDEQFATWSPDDKDFNLRLRRLGLQAREIPERFLNAIRHNDTMRFKEYPHVRAEARGEDSFEHVQGCDTTIANFGRFGEGVVFKEFDFSHPIRLGPVPTRIFGIGMHKTATTSLHHALKILGYDSVHWMSAHWAKAVYEQMTTLGRSIHVEEHYAFCDLPFTLLYKELDKAYPGSKFILTIRDESKWIESVRRHWDREQNPFRSTWDHDPFSHRVHKLLYGRRDFDAETMLNRYRRHNAEVHEYFGTNGPNYDRCFDLLEMDMDVLDSINTQWFNLCTFLNVPIPDVPYPKAFVTDNHHLEVQGEKKTQ